jgi:hypothetical protein
MQMSTSEATTSMAALVEALHPDGAASGPAELIVAHDASAATVRRLASDLGRDGIAWVAVRPGRRRAARRRLRAAGLRVSGSWLAVPARSPRALVPLEPSTGAVRSLLGASLPGVGRWRLMLRFDGRLLEALAPGVGLVAQKVDARPQLAWLAAAGSPGTVAVSAGWHEPAEGLVLHGAQVIVKSSRAGARRNPRLEAATLRRLGPAAREAGAAVPTVLYDGPAGLRVALAEETLAGLRAAGLLRASPDRLRSFLRDLGEWLARWHEATRLTRPLSEDDLERFVLAPARAVAPLVSGGNAYVERLAELGRRQVGSSVPFAAAHNDLTTWNVLVDGKKLAIVDWEAAEPEALPLVDLDYVIVDAVSVARRRSRDEAFARCSGGGPDADLAGAVREDVRVWLDVTPEAAELARHACWLGHARNEADRAPAGGPRPFLAIVGALAAA